MVSRKRYQTCSEKRFSRIVIYEGLLEVRYGKINHVREVV